VAKAGAVMSRHGYTDDYGCDDNTIHLYRGAVERAIAGKRGQRLLRRLIAALEAMPEKRLAHGVVPGKDDDYDENAHALVHEGGCCAFGAVALAEKMPDWTHSLFEPSSVASAFDVAQSMAAEIEYINDDRAPSDPEKRWQYVYDWAKRNIVEAQS
jgi:hypothetical protein